jgi:hypothetical protein
MACVTIHEDPIGLIQKESLRDPFQSLPQNADFEASAAESDNNTSDSITIQRDSMGYTVDPDKEDDDGIPF